MDYKQLRSTPGYTNYVPGLHKNIDGTISSAELKRYYSSIDASIYINGEWIEDITDINWTVSQNTLPLFGYNSYIFDDVAQGQRMINGMFIINFTKPNKIPEVIATGNAAEYVNGKKVSIKDESELKIGNGGNFEIDENWIINSENLATKQNANAIIDNPKHYHVWKDRFDIDIVCGEADEKSGPPVHIVLINCYITGSAQQRNSGGDVAVEQYNFIAQDFVSIQ